MGRGDESGKMDLGMTASDDELGLRRWSGMGRENGMYAP